VRGGEVGRKMRGELVAVEGVFSARRRRQDIAKRDMRGAAVVLQLKRLPEAALRLRQRARRELPPALVEHADSVSVRIGSR
jgi:hypothetical protein